MPNDTSRQRTVGMGGAVIDWQWKRTNASRDGKNGMEELCIAQGKIRNESETGHLKAESVTLMLVDKDGIILHEETQKLGFTTRTYSALVVDNRIPPEEERDFSLRFYAREALLNDVDILSARLSFSLTDDPAPTGPPTKQ